MRVIWNDIYESIWSLPHKQIYSFLPQMKSKIMIVTFTTFSVQVFSILLKNSMLFLEEQTLETDSFSVMIITIGDCFILYSDLPFLKVILLILIIISKYCCED